MNSALYYLEMFVDWTNKWQPIAIGLDYKPKGYISKRQAIEALDNEARKYRGRNRYRIIKAGTPMAYKSITTGGMV